MESVDNALDTLKLLILERYNISKLSHESKMIILQSVEKDAEFFKQLGRAEAYLDIINLLEELKKKYA